MTQKMANRNGGLVVFAFAYFIWPTPYAYYTGIRPVWNDAVYLVRRNRFTNSVEFYFADFPPGYNSHYVGGSQWSKSGPLTVP